MAKAATEKKLNKDELIETIKGMSALEISELVKELEEVFGVSAAAPVALAAAAPGVAAAEAPAVEEEKTTFDVILLRAGDKKIQVIKEVRAITGLGLKEAKEIVDASPKAIKEGVNKDEAERVKVQLEETGASVEIK